MRLFVALGPDDAAVDRIGAFVRACSAKIPDVKWARAQNIHLTLLFIGETGEERLDEIRAGLRAAVENFSPFTFRLDKKDLFGNRGRSILWVGASQAPELEKLAGAVRGGLQAFGDHKKPFKPHLTIGRAGRPVYRSLLARVPWDPVDYRAKSVHLIKSELLPRGARYTLVEAFPLEAA